MGKAILDFVNVPTLRRFTMQIWLWLKNNFQGQMAFHSVTELIYSTVLDEEIAFSIILAF